MLIDPVIVLYIGLGKPSRSSENNCNIRPEYIERKWAQHYADITKLICN